MMTLTGCTGLYYKLHGVHRPVTMKKATIKRRKRVIPANQDDDTEETSETTEGLLMERTPPRGSMNDDGSVNLGLRRHAAYPIAIEPRPVSSPGRKASPLPTTSDLAAYHQQSLRPRHPPQSLSDDNRLPPLASMHSAVDRGSSISPASFISLARKRSFSSAEHDARHVEDHTHDGVKRLSSIKSLLNASKMSGEEDDRSRYSLPPLRSPAGTSGSGTSTIMYGHGKSTPGASSTGTESEDSRADRRAALQKEAENMRAMLAAKERELLDLGE